MMVKNVNSGEYLKNLRIQKDLTVKEVIRRSKGALDKSVISRVEKNKRGISLRSAYYMAKIYQVPLEEIAEAMLGLKPLDQEPPFRISNAEQKIITYLRKLNKDKKKQVEDVIQGFVALAKSCPDSTAFGAAPLSRM